MSEKKKNNKIINIENTPLPMKGTEENKEMSVREAREELLHRLQDKIREEVKEEEREKLREEMREEVREELKKELREEVLEELRREAVKENEADILADEASESEEMAEDIEEFAEEAIENSGTEEVVEEATEELEDEDLESVDINDDEDLESVDINDNEPSENPEEGKNKKPVFLICLGIYAIIWIIATIIVCVILTGKFSNYQNNYDAAKAAIQPDTVAANELYRFDADHLRDSAGEGWILLNKYECDDVIDRYISDTLSGRAISCSANEAYTERHPSYDVYADDLLLGTITLKHKTESDEFGFCDYDFSELQVLLGGPEMETYTIKCYEGDDVYVNGEKLEADDETVFLTEDTELDSYMSQAASVKSGVSINECVYTLTDFIDEPTVTLEKYDNTYTVSDNSLRDEIVAVGDEDTQDSDHYFNACVFFDDQLDYDLNDRLYNGFVVAGENFIYNMNLWGSFANVSKYLETGGAAYNAIASAQSGLSWAGRPDEFEIKSTEILSIVKYDDDTLVVTTYHTIHRLYRSVTYEEDMTVEWLYCKNGNAWLIRNFSYL